MTNVADALNFFTRYFGFTVEGVKGDNAAKVDTLFHQLSSNGIPLQDPPGIGQSLLHNIRKVRFTP